MDDDTKIGVRGVWWAGLVCLAVACLSIPANGETDAYEWGWVRTEQGCDVWTSLRPAQRIEWSGAAVEGKAHGYGTLKKYTNGVLHVTLDGHMNQGRSTGFGVITCAWGDTYRGFIGERGAEGLGVVTTAEGDRDEGQFSGGCLDGLGVRLLPEGTSWAGEFTSGMPNGLGVFAFSDGDSCTGELSDGDESGLALIVSVEGGSIRGEFNASFELSGLGCFHYPGGVVEEGEFRDGVLEGLGVHTSPSEGRTAGEFKEGMPYGLGVTELEGGMVYAGEIEDYSLHGMGVITSNDVTLYEGEFENDELIGSIGDKSAAARRVAQQARKAASLAEHAARQARALPVDETVKFAKETAQRAQAMAKAARVAVKRKSAPVDERAVGQRWAVIIGVSKYNDSRIPPLKYAAADARAFHAWCVDPKRGGYAPSRVKLLTDGQATAVEVRRALFKWLKQAIAEDLVTIYLAGHGSPESPDTPDNLFFLVSDTDYADITSTAFPMWDIHTALKRFIKAKKVVVLADACHSGGVGASFDVMRRSSRGIRPNRISGAFQDLATVGPGVCVLSASGEDQLSQEGAQWGGHGVFTHFLLKGLGGAADYDGNASVTLGELVPYLSEQVRRATVNAQAPTVAGKFDPALIMGRRLGTGE